MFCFVDWLIDWIEFYAVSAIFQPCNGGFCFVKPYITCDIFISIHTKWQRSDRKYLNTYISRKTSFELKRYQILFALFHTELYCNDDLLMIKTFNLDIEMILMEMISTKINYFKFRSIRWTQILFQNEGMQQGERYVFPAPSPFICCKLFSFVYFSCTITLHFPFYVLALLLSVSKLIS